ncbi:diacylglycerol kinase family protein [Henriciella aquimarina]|uniref:hypothetical protein n=1 Tax=Henriciella aquimarina TaxID=545261 RepID=UPI000A0662A3|nr:hypothetical protein [Henriciella aquimarina]
MGKIALISNARSHLVARKGSRLEEVACRKGELPLVWFESMALFRAKITGLMESGYDTFLIEAGDGTVLATLTCCYNHDPARFGALRFAVLPGGSTNLAYERLGLKQPGVEDVVRRLDALDDDTSAGAVTQLPALAVRLGEARDSHVGFLLSTGALARGMDHVQHHMFGEGQRGSAAVALSLLKLAARPRHYMAADGEPLLRPSRFEPKTSDMQVEAGPHAFSLATTFPSLSLGLTPFWGEEAKPIRFTYAPWPPAKLRRAILRSATGRGLERLETDGYRSINTDALAMTVDGPLMLDGELLQRDSSISIRVGTTGDICFLR